MKFGYFPHIPHHVIPWGQPLFQTTDTTTEANPSTVASGNFTTVSEDSITTFNETIVGGNSTIDEPTTTVESFDYL